MTGDRRGFRVTALHASVAEGVPLEWLGKQLHSGPLWIELEEDAGVEESRGELDYAQGRAAAEFHVRVAMPELTELLQTLGVRAELLKPIRAIVQSEGRILEDHSFNLIGTCRMEPHDLFNGAEARMLPGH
jgi:hypothetical protein